MYVSCYTKSSLLFGDSYICGVKTAPWSDRPEVLVHDGFVGSYASIRSNVDSAIVQMMVRILLSVPIVFWLIRKRSDAAQIV